MPTCGDKYKDILVTRDGKTPADPWEWFAGPDDYDAWYDVVHTVGHEVTQRWNWLLSIENKLASAPPDPEGPQGPYPERDLVLELLRNFSTELDDHHHVLVESLDVGLEKVELTWATTIREVIETAQRGTCLMERLDEAAEYYERPPLPGPHEPAEGADKREDEDEDEDEGGGIGGVLLTLGLLGGAAYLIWKRKKR